MLSRKFLNVDLIEMMKKRCISCIGSLGLLPKGRAGANLAEEGASSSRDAPKPTISKRMTSKRARAAGEADDDELPPPVAPRGVQRQQSAAGSDSSRGKQITQTMELKQ